MAYYWLKQACQLRTLVITDDGWEIAEGKDLVLKLFVVNGLPEKLDGEVSLEVWSQDGRKVHEGKWHVCADGQHSWEVAVVEIPSAKLEKGVYLVRSVLLDEAGRRRQMDRLFACPNWALAKETIRIPAIKKRSISQNQIEFQNSGSEIAFAIELESSLVHLSDNFFNLLPGETKVIEDSFSDLKNIRIFGRLLG
jgi:hypothetical protein